MDELKNKKTEQKEISINEAIARIGKELKENKNFYSNWQSCVAVPFIVELNKRGHTLSDEREIAIKAASEFLDRLILTIKFMRD